jgi:Holliday junction DNA helicase RuvA
MIAFVKGMVDEVGEDFVIIDTGQGLGYRVALAQDSPLLKSMSEGKEVKLYTSQYFRENDQGLFGFKNSQQRNFYELLITVSGVGPKLASTLLAHIDPADLARMIINSDIDSMTEVPGIGQKMAERLVVDLRDRVLGEGLITESDVERETEEKPSGGYEEELLFLEQALQKLGFGNSEIDAMRKKAKDIIADGASVEEALRKLLDQGR